MVTTFYPVSEETLAELPPVMRSELRLDASLFLYRVLGYIWHDCPTFDRNANETADLLLELAGRCRAHAMSDDMSVAA